MATNFATAFLTRPQPPANEPLPTGISSLDRLIQGFPRGAICEIAGPESSGRATVVQSLLATSTTNSEICAYVDVNNSLDPHSAAAAGTALDQLLWVRFAGDVECAFKAADLLLHAGGFGVVVLDLSLVPDRALRRIPLSYWFRFRRAIENTPTILALLTREPQAKSSASLILELTRLEAIWSGAPGFQLLKEVSIQAGCRKPMRPVAIQFQAKAVA